MEVLFTKFMPMFILIFLGYRMQSNQKITDEVIEGMKYILFNLAIPSLLFLSYINASLQLEYTLIFSILFGAGCLMLFIGKLLKKHLNHEYASWYLAGFENGMIGIPIFTSIWGMSVLPLLSLISLGNALFVWFVYIPLIEYKNNSSVNMKKYLLSMLKSPILLSIVVGMVLNMTGIFNFLESNIVIVGLVNLLQTLSSLATALILLILGYSIKLNNIDIVLNTKYIVIRLIFVIAIAFSSLVIIRQLIGEIEPIFSKLYIAYFMLPPVYILPPFIAKEKNDEINFFSNSILIYTFISFAGIMIWSLV